MSDDTARTIAIIKCFQQNIDDLQAALDEVKGKHPTYVYVWPEHALGVMHGIVAIRVDRATQYTRKQGNLVFKNGKGEVARFQTRELALSQAVKHGQDTLAAFIRSLPKEG